MRALSSSLYKDTTFFAEIQIALTFRNTPRNVKMQRFAADGVGQVLYYEAAHSEQVIAIGEALGEGALPRLPTPVNKMESWDSIFPKMR